MFSCALSDGVGGWGGKGKVLPFCFKLCQQNVNPVIQFMDIRILQKILWTLRLVFLCALSIPSTRPFLTTTLGQTGVLFSICWKKSYWYYGHLVIAYWTYKTLSKWQSSFPRFFVGGWKNQTLSPLSASLFDLKCMPFEAYVMVDTELWYDANGLPGYKHIKPCLLAGFFDEYTKQYSQQSPGRHGLTLTYTESWTWQISKLVFSATFVVLYCS